MTTVDTLLQDYLARLEAAAQRLPTDVRDDLLTEVRAHLDELRASTDDEAVLRQALDRLGAPEAIVAEAAQGAGVAGHVAGGDVGAGAPAAPMAPPAPPAPSAPPRRSRALDIAAVVLLLIGGFVIPGVGWIVGVVLLWVSGSWTTGEKLLGTLVWPGGLLLPGLAPLLAFRSGGSCVTLSEVTPDGERILSDTCEAAGGLVPWLGSALVVVAVLAPIVVAVVLLRRAEARR